VHEGNVVAIAFNSRPELDIPALYERAAQVAAATRMPAKSWVNGIKSWQTQQ
jgi:spermidine synthase